MLKPIYRPSIKRASRIAWLCIFTAPAALALWYFIPGLRALPWIGDGLFALMLFSAIMGAWHDGHAIGEKKGRESGSAIFLILIAIVLLAALTAALNQGSRTSTGMMTDQQAKLAASEIIAYSNQLQQAVQTKLLQGCSETQFDFANTAWLRTSSEILYDTGHNPDATEDCAIFNHGGIQPVIWHQSYTLPNSSATEGHGRILTASVPGVGTDAQDLLYRTFGIKLEICLKINEMLGVKNPDNAPPKFTGSRNTPYHGNNLATGTNNWTSDDGSIVGKSVFCALLNTDTGSSADYYQVLLAR